MKSYDETLTSIREKAAELVKKQKERKRKAKTVLYSAVPVILVIGVIIAIGTAGPLNRPDDREPGQTGSLTEGTAPAQTEPSVVTTDSVVLSDVEPSIYPQAWRKMNAFLIRWGEPTDATYSESRGLWYGGTMTPLVIDYTGVSVTILKCFESTVEREYDERERFGLGDAIGNFGELYVERELLEQIRPGDTSLVFVKLLASKSRSDPSGAQLTGIDSQGNPAGLFDYLFTPGFTSVPGPEFDPLFAVFPVVDNKLVIPDKAYVQRDNGDWLLYQMSLLQYANRIIELRGLDEIPAFRSGMPVEEIEEFFDYFCGSDYH